ncbi:MAG: DUF2172 domain-containing protein [Bacillota bacterium]|nr:DUF2172 domain-containing protein [Bacillota bacterium]
MGQFTDCRLFLIVIKNMLELLKKLAPLKRVFVSSDYDYAIDVLKTVLDFDVLEYSSETAHNGWVIPPKWDVVEAKIIKNGNVILDVQDHVLHVICYSAAFEGRVTLEELKQHLHYDHRYADAIPYHFRQSYRNWERDWGFCVTKNFYASLEPGEYDVVIKTKEDQGILKVLEYTHAGEMEESFVFVAHQDHPGMANDDLAGCVVGVELFKRLLGQKTKYSYKLVRCPG